MSDVLLTNAAAIAALMIIVWIISLPLRDVSIVDLIWGLGFVLVGWLTFAVTDSAGPSRWLIVVLTTLWGCRLSAYLAWRNHGEPEDKRYARMRDRWGSAFPLVSLFTVFALQGTVMWVVSLPIQLGILHSTPGWGVLHVIGIGMWCVGFFFEAVGDWQMARFQSISDNDEVLDDGLWRYTRHPNYFGDFCIWWGIYLIAIAGGAAWWTIVGPIVMSIFLMFISGVTLLERDLQDRKAKYKEYVRKTSPFFPWRSNSD